MAAHLVRLRLPPQVLARVHKIELRHHLDTELSNFAPYLTPETKDLLLDNLLFLLTSPLFLYATSPRIRRANVHGGNASSSAHIDIRRLNLITTTMNNKQMTALHYGNAALIEVKHLHATKPTECRRSIQWFSDEVEFLACEYRARELAEAERSSNMPATPKKSRIVRLKVERPKGIDCRPSAVSKSRIVKLKVKCKKLMAMQGLGLGRVCDAERLALRLRL